MRIGIRLSGEYRMAFQAFSCSLFPPVAGTLFPWSENRTRIASRMRFSSASCHSLRMSYCTVHTGLTARKGWERGREGGKQNGGPSTPSRVFSSFSPSDGLRGGNTASTAVSEPHASASGVSSHEDVSDDDDGDRRRRRRREGRELRHSPYGPSMGYSRKKVMQKASNPRATKPWQNRHAVTSGAIFVSPQADVGAVVGEEGDDGAALPSVSPSSSSSFLHHMGHLTTSGVMGMRSAHLSVDAAAHGFRQGLDAPAVLPPSSSSRSTAFSVDGEKGEEEMDDDDDEGRFRVSASRDREPEEWREECTHAGKRDRQRAMVEEEEDRYVPSTAFSTPTATATATATATSHAWRQPDEEEEEWQLARGTPGAASSLSFSSSSSSSSSLRWSSGAPRREGEGEGGRAFPLLPPAPVIDLYAPDAGVASPFRRSSVSVTGGPREGRVAAAAPPAPLSTMAVGTALRLEVDHVDSYVHENSDVGGKGIPLTLQAHMLRRDRERDGASWRGEAPPPPPPPPFSFATEHNTTAIDTAHPSSSSSCLSSSSSSSSLVSLEDAGKQKSKRELANAIRLPRNLNAIFHQIMGWSETLESIQREKAEERGEREDERHPLHPWQKTGMTGEAQDGDAPYPLARREERQRVREKMQEHAHRMKYGVLLADYEKDEFALSQQLSIAGKKMERKFLHWEGMHVLDHDHTEPMPFVREHKAAIVLQTPSTFSIPVMHRDCCPGCGALFQDSDTDGFGFVRPGEVERFLAQRDRIAEVKEEYATRMAELQRHWETHGRQVGEEWLDFMTQEEFDAFYRYRPSPFVCRRCHCLQHLGVVGRRQVWSAPDFTESLRALREKRCLVVLVVDITDFPGSMVYNLPGLISMNNPVIIAANKMDCVRNRSFRYTHKDKAVSAALVSEGYIRRWVQDIAMAFKLPKEQIKAVVPVSAKRGWNVDALVEAVEEHSNLNLRRPHAPRPTYFVGAANVGKSSVINAIAHHLYVPQPPHPESKKVYYTIVDRKTGDESIHWRWYTPPNVNRAEMVDIPSRHDKKSSALLTVSSLPGTTVAVNAVKIALSGARRTSSSTSSNNSSKSPEIEKKDGEGGRHAMKTNAQKEDEWMQHSKPWLYDTPGVLPHWHASSPLTLLQMRRLLQRKFRHPQCFLLVPGTTLLLAGLAAIDVVKGCTQGMLFMVYTSSKAQHGIVQTSHADAFWREALGQRIGPPDSYEQLEDHVESLQVAESETTTTSRTRTATSPSSSSSSSSVPSGDSLLSISKSYVFECYPRHRRRPVADIYFCGLGWVSFCVREAADVVLRVRTIPGVMHGVRRPLRYNDLRSFRTWPKIRRAFTHRSIQESEKAREREKSITTVVRMVAGSSNGGSGGNGGGEDDDGAKAERHLSSPPSHASTNAGKEGESLDAGRRRFDQKERGVGGLVGPQRPTTGRATGSTPTTVNGPTRASSTEPKGSHTTTGEENPLSRMLHADNNDTPSSRPSSPSVLPSALANMAVEVRTKIDHPQYASSSSTPLMDLLDDLSASSSSSA